MLGILDGLASCRCNGYSWLKVIGMCAEPRNENQDPPPPPPDEEGAGVFFKGGESPAEILKKLRDRNTHVQTDEPQSED